MLSCVVGTLQTNIAGMCGECSQCMDHTGFAPAHSGLCFLDLNCSDSRCSARHCPQRALHFVHFPGLSCLGSGSWVLHKGTDSGVHFVSFPGPTRSGDQMLGECTVPGGPCLLITCLVLATWFLGCVRRALSQVCCVFPLGS